MSTNNFKWEELLSSYNYVYTNLIDTINEKISYLDSREDKITDFTDRCKHLIDAFFKILKDTIFSNQYYCWCNIPTIEDLTQDENFDKEWKEYNDDNTEYIGLLNIFDYYIPVFNDDYGQQVFCKFKFVDGRIIDIGNGTYNFSLSGILTDVIDCISEDVFLSTKKKIEYYLERK